MTPGVALLLAQARLVATVRRWDTTKTIKKLRDLADALEQAQLTLGAHKAAAAKPKAVAPPPKLNEEESKLIQQAEQILKDLSGQLLTDPPEESSPTD